jgi:hypothetical protein
MSENRIAHEISIASSKNSTYDEKSYEYVDKSIFSKSIDPYFHPEEVKQRINREYTLKKYAPKEIIKIQKEEEVNEPDFHHNFDYKEISIRLNIDLFKIQKRINYQALEKGGFTNFIYKSKNYEIPLLPLLAWISKGSNSNSQKIFKINNYTWNSVSPKNIKTSNDNLFHSDWWIGAGFPINIYNETYKYRAFNKAITKFALEINGKSSLNDIQFLAGKGLPSISGKIVKYPSSINDFNEDDIIVLPSGGVKFDSYIKKACKNKKGAVILEIGNKVAHLTIISRELNSKDFGYRLILLPDANELLENGSIIKIDSINNKITRL